MKVLAFFCLRSLLLLSFAFLGSISTWFRCQRSSCCWLLNAQCGTTQELQDVGLVSYIGFPSVSGVTVVPSFFLLVVVPSQCAKQVRYDVVYPPKGACLLEGTTQDIEVFLSFVR